MLVFVTRSRFHLSSFRCDSVRIFMETCKEFAIFCRSLFIQEMECLTCNATQSTSDTAETIHSIGNLDLSGHFLPATQPRPPAVPTHAARQTSSSSLGTQPLARNPSKILDKQSAIHTDINASNQPARHALNQSKHWANHRLLPSLPSPRSWCFRILGAPVMVIDG